ncbi:MAG: AAA family ATPase, partial [Sphingomonadales bacterium]
MDDVLDELFPHLAAIALEGAKGVGKTATASQRAASLLAVDNPAQRETLAADLEHVRRLAPPVLIDEWQLLPEVWDRVRRAVEERIIAR